MNPTSRSEFAPYIIGDEGLDEVRGGIIQLLVLAAAVFSVGYVIGKDLAQSDNAK